jgi:endo-1,4-beta-xylanase
METQDVDQRGEPLRATAGGPVGAADEPDLLESDAEYRDTVVREFNAVTPENAMKWERIHPAAGEWSFEPADRLVAFAEAHGMRIHGHALVWHRQLADWLTPGLAPEAAGHAALATP